MTPRTQKWIPRFPVRSSPLQPKLNASPVKEPDRALQILPQSLGLDAPQAYRPGAELLSAGWPAREMLLITSGIVGLCYALDTGDEVLFMLSYPGHLINVCVPDPSDASPISAVALCSCHAYRLSVEALREGESREPQISTIIQRQLKTQVGLRTAALARCLAQSPAERYERLLCEIGAAIGERLPDDRMRIRLPLITDDHFAMLLGISLRHFKRLKNDFQHRGCVQFERGTFVWKPSQPFSQSITL